MKTSWSAEFSIFEDMPIVLVGVVELLVGLVGITGCKKKQPMNTLMFSTLQVTTKSRLVMKETDKRPVLKSEINLKAISLKNLRLRIEI